MDRSEMPSINNYSPCSNTMRIGDAEQWAAAGNAYGGIDNTWLPSKPIPQSMEILQQIADISNRKNPELKRKDAMTEKKDQTRVVRVFVADPDVRIPVDRRLLSSTDEKVTEGTDQELFYELDIKPLLEKHNEYRVTVLDKAASNKFGRDVFLEPIKIRDLVMTVVCVAAF